MRSRELRWQVLKRLFAAYVIFADLFAQDGRQRWHHVELAGALDVGHGGEAEAQRMEGHSVRTGSRQRAQLLDQATDCITMRGEVRNPAVPIDSAEEWGPSASTKFPARSGARMSSRRGQRPCSGMGKDCEVQCGCQLAGWERWLTLGLARSLAMRPVGGIGAV